MSRIKHCFLELPILFRARSEIDWIAGGVYIFSLHLCIVRTYTFVITKLKTKKNKSDKLNR